MKVKNKTPLFQVVSSKTENQINRLHFKLICTKLKAKDILATSSGDGYFDSGLKVLMAVVIGGLLLVSSYALWKSNIIPTVTGKINDMFNYSA